MPHRLTPEEKQAREAAKQAKKAEREAKMAERKKASELRTVAAAKKRAEALAKANARDLAKAKREAAKEEAAEARAAKKAEKAAAAEAKKKEREAKKAEKEAKKAEKKPVTKKAPAKKAPVAQKAEKETASAPKKKGPIPLEYKAIPMGQESAKMLKIDEGLALKEAIGEDTEQDRRELWFHRKYDADPFYEDYLYIIHKARKGEFEGLTPKKYRDAVHIDGFPNTQKMTEFFEDLHFARPKDYELLHKNASSKSMIGNKKAEKRFKSDTAEPAKKAPVAKKVATTAVTTLPVAESTPSASLDLSKIPGSVLAEYHMAKLPGKKKNTTAAQYYEKKYPGIEKTLPGKTKSAAVTALSSDPFGSAAPIQAVAMDVDPFSGTMSNDTRTKLTKAEFNKKVTEAKKAIKAKTPDLDKDQVEAFARMSVAQKHYMSS